MTWKRVLTAAVLVPAVVLLVFEASTAVVSLAVALVMLFALFEYFALGDAIGHRAYRYWTATCALLIVYLQWLATVEASYELSGGLTLLRPISRFVRGLPPVHDAYFFSWWEWPSSRCSRAGRWSRAFQPPGSVLRDCSL